MRIVFVILLSLLTYSSYAQFFGYQGKRFEITTGLAFMPNPAIINPMRYGVDKDIPSGFALPYSPFLEFNFALSRHIGVGLKVWYAKNFVGYRVAGVKGGYNTSNDIPEELQLQVQSEVFNFKRNHTIRTYYTGITLRYYTRSFIAPAGNYFEFGYGKVNVIADANDTYELNTDKIFYSPYGNAVPVYSSQMTTEFMEQPKIEPITLLSFGYYVRKETKLIDNLMYDVGATFSFGMGGKPGSVENAGAFSNQYNVQVSSKDDLDELIKGTSYTFIRKQNFIRVNAKLIYLF